jgi:tryptophan-rich sensory protein
MKKASQLLGAILLCQLAGAIGSVFTASSVKSWYPTLIKPSFNPPSWLFGPVWITLYAMMGVALYLVWREKQAGKEVRLAMWIFLTQLAVNAAWSIVFFGLKNIGGALFVIVALWLMIAVSIWLFFPIKKAAAWLLAPYLLWVSFASVLNFALWRLN